jgi:hypothetical protein
MIRDPYASSIQAELRARTVLRVLEISCAIRWFLITDFSDSLPRRPTARIEEINEPLNSHLDYPSMIFAGHLQTRVMPICKAESTEVINRSPDITVDAGAIGSVNLARC